MPEDVLALLESADAHLTAASTYEATGQKMKKEAALAQAGLDLEGLPRDDAKRVEVAYERWNYLQYVGDEAGLLQLVRSGGERTDDWLAALYYALTLYRHGEPESALEMLERGRPSIDSDQLRVCVLAELPNGPAKAAGGLQGNGCAAS